MVCQDLLYNGAAQTPDAVALHWIDRDRKLTYRQAVAEMERVAGALAALGVGHGDRVGILAHNGMDYLMAMFGAWRLGAVAAPVDLQWADALDHYINDASPKVLIYTHDKYESIHRCRPLMPTVEHYICMDGAQPGALDWGKLLADAPAPPPDPTRSSDPAYLWYEPASTASPDKSALTQAAALSAAENLAQQLQLDRTDATLGPTPLSHAYHLVANLLPGLSCGATVGVMGRWQPDSGWQALEALGVTVLVATPTHIQHVVDVSRAKGHSPARLRVALSSQAPLPSALKSSWQDELGRVKLVEMMTFLR